MSFDAFLRGLSFNLLSPEAKIGADNRFHLDRPDGSVATLLDADAFVLEWANTTFPPEQASQKSSLEQIADMPKMSTLAIGAIINSAVSHMPAGQAFVNVGVWHGYSFLAGLHGNQDKPSTGIDNFSQFGGPKDEFTARFEAQSSPQHSFVESDYRDFFRGFSDPIGVYIYDGEHTYESQVEGLRVAEPLMEDGCIVIVDDANWRRPRKATYDFIANSSRDYSVLLDIRTSGQHPTFWNGILVLRVGASDGETISEIPNPGFHASEEPPQHSGKMVSALIGPGDAEARDRTRRALENHGEVEVEILTFGEKAGEASGPGDHLDAGEAFAASTGDYAMLLNAGAEPALQAVEREIAKFSRAEAGKPYDWRNQRGLLRS